MMAPRRSIGAWILFVAAYASNTFGAHAAENEGCSWRDPDTGKQYDISALTRTVVGKEYVFTDKDIVYKANICGRATSKCNADIPPGSTPVAFMYRKNQMFGDICVASLGDLMSAATWSTFREKTGERGFQVRYTGGTSGCPPPAPSSRSVTYKFICDHSQRDEALLVKGEEPKVSENVQKGATGSNVIPHRDEIYFFFDLVKEGIEFTKEILVMLFNKIRSGNGYGYTAIPQADGNPGRKVKLPKAAKPSTKKYGSSDGPDL